MSNKQAKRDRSAIRDEVQAILPELLKTEAFKGLYERLAAQNKHDLEKIADEVRGTLQQIDQRSKDISQYMMNAATGQTYTEVKSPEEKE